MSKKPKNLAKPAIRVVPEMSINKETRQLAIVAEIAPNDAIEALLATQIAAVHIAILYGGGSGQKPIIVIALTEHTADRRCRELKVVSR